MITMIHGNQVDDLIYSTPTGLWIIWKDTGIAYKIMDYGIQSLSMTVSQTPTVLSFLASDKEYFVENKPNYSLDLSIIMSNVEQKKIKHFSDIFSVEDIKKISKMTTRKFRRMI